MSIIPIYQAPEARATILRRAAWEDQAMPARVLDGIERIFGARLAPAEAVRRILADVRTRGDAALAEWSARIDGSAEANPTFEIPPAAWAAAYDRLPADQRAALDLAAARIAAFHRKQPMQSWIDAGPEGTLGQLIRPIERVGVYVPGGTAPLPSSLLMAAIPARVAGVAQVIVCTPPSRPNSDRSTTSGLEASAGFSSQREQPAKASIPEDTSGLEASAGFSSQREQPAKASIPEDTSGLEASAGFSSQREQPAKASIPEDTSGLEASAGFSSQREQPAKASIPEDTSGLEASAGFSSRRERPAKPSIPEDKSGLEASAGFSSQREQPAKASIPEAQSGVADLILAAAHVSGVDRLFALGGAQAIGAMAYGTATVPAVDKIVGAGGLFVTLAKRQVIGSVGIDGFYGPTETLVIADATADPAWAAADLLAQAEHDVLASPILLTPSRPVAEAVAAQIEAQLTGLSRAEIAAASLSGRGGIVLTADLDEAVELANAYAPEHLCLLVADPWALVGRIRNAGGIFVGEHSFEVLGDYVAGPSHVMPTEGSARYASPLSVADFVKRISLIALDAEAGARLSAPAAILARGEGLTAHAAAAEMRVGQ